MGSESGKSELKQVFTTTQVGRICGVTQQAVIKWIDSGRLEGYRLPNSRARRVTREALLKFMKANNLPTRSLDQNTIKVLVVDDEEMVADMVQLEFGGDDNVEVRKALRGFDAGVVAEYQPDVVILDIMLPDMDGRRVCELIREGAGGKEMRIIGISGYADSLNINEMLAGGFDGFISKPFTPGQIREIVTSCRFHTGLEKYHLITGASAAPLAIAPHYENTILFPFTGAGGEVGLKHSPPALKK